MKKNRKRWVYQHLLPRAGLFLVTLLSRTFRVAILEPENETVPLEKHNSLIYVSWHQRFFPGITLFASRKPIAIMISQSRDGDLISAVVRLLGWEPVRGSSSRGGKKALIRLKRLSADGYRIGHIVDGPKGPFGVVKPGVVTMAQITGIPIVPVIASAERRWQARSWDRFMIPKPYSRIIIRFGKPLYVPRDLAENRFEAIRLEIETRLAGMYKATDSLWQDSNTVEKLFGRGPNAASFIQ